MRIFIVILCVLGGLSLLVVFAFIGLFGTLITKYGPVTEEAAEYANESVRAIASDWNRDEILNRASPELKGVLTDAAINQLIDFGKYQLGSMTRFEDDASCSLNRLEYSTGRGEFAVAECSASAEFEKAYGTFRIGALKRNGAWKLTAFYVNGELRESGPVRTAEQPSIMRLTNFEVSFADPFVAVESPGIDGLDIGITSGAALFQDLPENVEEAASELK